MSLKEFTPLEITAFDGDVEMVDSGVSGSKGNACLSASCSVVLGGDRGSRISLSDGSIGVYAFD